MCLAQGHNTFDAGEAWEPATPRSWVKHSTNALLNKVKENEEF